MKTVSVYGYGFFPFILDIKCTSYFFPNHYRQFSLFLYKMCGLEKLGLVDQNWLERNFSGFLLRTLVVGRRQHSESIEVVLDME